MLEHRAGRPANPATVRLVAVARAVPRKVRGDNGK